MSAVTVLLALFLTPNDESIQTISAEFCENSGKVQIISAHKSIVYFHLRDAHW